MLTAENARHVLDIIVKTYASITDGASHDIEDDLLTGASAGAGQPRRAQSAWSWLLEPSEPTHSRSLAAAGDVEGDGLARLGCRA